MVESHTISMCVLRSVSGSRFDSGSAVSGAGSAYSSVLRLVLRCGWLLTRRCFAFSSTGVIDPPVVVAVLG